MKDIYQKNPYVKMLTLGDFESNKQVVKEENSFFFLIKSINSSFFLFVFSGKTLKRNLISIDIYIL